MQLMPTENIAFFTCRSCGVELTELLRCVPAMSLCWVSDKAALPPSDFASAPDTFTYQQLHARGGAKYMSADGELLAIEIGDYILNPEALKGAFVAGASYGCCGFQPRSESNFACVNGHAVATVHTDCWLPRFARLWGTSVEMKKI
jgi:hypothetical protein